MLVIDFEYYNKESGTYETDQIECENFQDFKDWINNNDVKIYEILDIRIDN